MYVLRRAGDGKFVAMPGREHSYTKRLEDAQTFASRERAERGKCDNEYAVSVEDIIGKPY